MRPLLLTFLVTSLASPATAAVEVAPAPEWVVYATEIGWLRVGPRAEFEQPWRRSDEIWGGQSADPLPKSLLWAGFASRDEALGWLSDRLTGLRVENRPTARPYQVIAAQFEGKPYWLRLDRGNDPEVVLFKGEEYDFETEWDLLARYGLTPRQDLGPRWLIHATGHGTVNGPVKDDRWLLFSSEPLPAEQAGEGRFYLPDGYGGTFAYSSDRWEGPYRDNYGLARAMKRLGVAEVEQWPPGREFTPKIVAARIPPNPRDHGRKALGLQTISDPPELRDWVIYVTAGQWLHVGTRKEFEQPVKARETVWGGTGDKLVTKEILPLAPRFYAYEQALATLLPALGELKIGFHPLADPRETVDAVVNGKAYHLQLARDPRAVVAGYGGYQSGAEIQLLVDHGVVPPKRFKPQWLVHATGHGTMSGPVKDDFWMMVGSQPVNNGVTLPDGMGGTFGYSVDRVHGPFTDSIALSETLRQLGLKSINLVAEDRSVSAELLRSRPPRPESPPKIVEVEPSQGEPGQTFYVTVIAEGMKPWYQFDFGQGVTVTDETCLGRNPDGAGDRWLATVSIGDSARMTLGTIRER